MLRFKVLSVAVPHYKETAKVNVKFTFRQLEISGPFEERADLEPDVDDGDVEATRQLFSQII